MIVEFYYRDKTVSTRQVDIPFTQKGKDEVHQMLRSGLVKKPKNWDRYKLIRSEVEK